MCVSRIATPSFTKQGGSPYLVSRTPWKPADSIMATRPSFVGTNSTREPAPGREGDITSLMSVTFTFDWA